jgi:LysR family transcriptional regulator for metE and metH
MIEIRHLNLINEIVTTGNVTRAAQKLHLTQPSLSHQLKEIESRLGVQLFLRVNKTMTLTPAGKRLLKAAESILPEIQRTEKEIRSIDKNGRELRVSTHCYTNYHWLPTFMKTFRVKHPEVTIEIVTEAMSAPVEFLLNGKIDLALTSQKTKDRGVHFEKLFDDEYVLLVPKGHKLARKPFAVPVDFAEDNLITYTEDFNRSYFGRHVLVPARVIPPKITQMQLTEARVEMVRAGMGITVLSRWLVRPLVGHGNDIAMVRITKSGFYRPWYLVTLEQQSKDPLLQTFREHLEKQQLGTKLPL